MVASHRARFDGARCTQAWNVRGAIGTPCAVSTRQIGATPKQSLREARNSQTDVVSGGGARRSPARRNLLPR